MLFCGVVHSELFDYMWSVCAVSLVSGDVWRLPAGCGCVHTSHVP
jgi:hypothetical protein